MVQIIFLWNIIKIRNCASEFFCSRRGSKNNLAFSFCKAWGNSAREACAVVAPVPMQFFLHAAQKFPLKWEYCQNLCLVKKLNRNNPQGEFPSASTWDVFFFLKWTFLPSFSSEKFNFRLKGNLSFCGIYKKSWRDENVNTQKWSSDVLLTKSTG